LPAKLFSGSKAKKRTTSPRSNNNGPKARSHLLVDEEVFGGVFIFSMMV
jgi:hypothetical protein